MDAVFRALADPSRRRLLDSLNERNGQSLSELCAGLTMTRQAVTKHLAVLEGARLVAIVRRGREKLHHLNAEPINEIAERWISSYHREHAHALADLKRALEDDIVSRTEFFYVTYIRTTPEQLWRALTEPEFTLRYWGAELKSDWQPGSPILWREGDGDYRDLDQVVLTAEPPRVLSYTWHNYQPQHAELFGWSDEQLAVLQQEKRSKVTFEIEPAGEASKLTVRHDGFDTETEMLKALSGGWPVILSNLKTLLETGEVLPEAAPAPASAESLRRG
ncbi:metalloregulator ArsR/SmtB family transcription factor [Amycolatopsis acidiphila]|uniref:Metalloregulator ArsR/SmtB family transcription factor n=1 Tax=Amycolatopsis acidiphila TaxID=715473 RepID=A0A558A5E2_9PSEU|nr:metalloregulator ArsR/SmtB family transcription factor [Amycolatopsis acidiphila]TVT19448.1 metalloregulator ArsR/SmtB family transcription factor [Amycolatopsis acidiphila]UIJ63926.1 metalloregulator ArsR/SmtB family transcription factor [Amycolatopsis acidiphila]